MHGEDNVSVAVGVVNVGLSVVVCRDSEGSLLTTVLKVVKVIEESSVTVEKCSELDAGCERKSDTKAEPDVASAVDVEGAVEASDVLASVGNLSFKLVGYTVPEKIEVELAEAAVDAAGILDCVFDNLELTTSAGLDAEDAAEITAEVATEIATEAAPEVAAEVAVEAAGGILACVLSVSLKLADPLELTSPIAVDKLSAVDSEAAVEASGVLTRVGNLSFKLVGYAVPEERELKPAEAAVDAAGILDCVFDNLELTTSAGLDAEDAADAAEITAEVATEIATEAAPEVAAEVAVEAAGGILACVLSVSLKLADPLELTSPIAVEKLSAVNSEAAVEASGVLTRVGNLSFKLVGYAVPEERELKPVEAAVDATGMLNCAIDNLELTTAAVLDAEDAAKDAAEIIAEVATEIAAKVTTEVTAEVAVEADGGILACALSALLKLTYPLELMSTIGFEKVPAVDSVAAVGASGVLTRVGNLSFKLVGYAVPEERETELAEDAGDAAVMLGCEIGKLELTTPTILDAEDTAEVAPEVAAEVSLEAAEILDCVLSASLGIGDPMELIGAVAVETDSVVDAETAVEASDVPTRVGNLSFKLVGYAVPDERGLELAEEAI
ncbi:hypothetical protein E4U58_005918 [Claviceps cyperi]|nr:hypothetical protein E4U58_005918 [Claviceps cyperi]